MAAILVVCLRMGTEFHIVRSELQHYLVIVIGAIQYNYKRINVHLYLGCHMWMFFFFRDSNYDYFSAPISSQGVICDLKKKVYFLFLDKVNIAVLVLTPLLCIPTPSTCIVLGLTLGLSECIHSVMAKGGD